MMSVYIDPLCNNGWKLGPNCHLVADSLVELVKFGTSIGLKEKWLQINRNPAHFDLTESRRKKAISRGAIELSRIEFARKFLNYRG